MEQPNRVGRPVCRQGRFGVYGGRFVPETLLPALEELTKAYAKLKRDAQFRKELSYYLEEYAGRPTPLYFARRLTEKYGARIYLKREDLAHTGAHKINNCLGQILLARRMGKKRIIAETGAGQHGVATATVAAEFGLECVIYMGAIDIKRQASNVFRMKLLGARVVPVTSGTKTLKDAINETIRDWVTNVKDTHYLLGSTVGPHPYPMMIRDFQSVIGKETRTQIIKAEGRLPDYLMACVGGGSNALGLFYPFLKDRKIKMIGVEAGGTELKPGKHSATLIRGRPGILHGSYSYLLQDKYGQILPAHSIAPGLDYPGVGPEHSLLKDSARVKYVSVTDREAVAAFSELSILEGIIPALEPAHALAYLKSLTLQSFSDGAKFARRLKPASPSGRKNSIVILCLSGRGDKDLEIVASFLGNKGSCRPLGRLYWRT